MQTISKVNRWRCPVCKRPAVSLGIDDLFSEILQEAAHYIDPEYAEISSSGGFHILDFEGNPAVLQGKRLKKDEDGALPIKRFKTSREYPELTEEIEEKAKESGGCLCPISLD